MDRTAARRLATLNQEGRRAIATLPARDRAMMLMCGTFGSRPRTLVDVARTFGVSPNDVRYVECKLFHLLGDEWEARWREARRATDRYRRRPYERRTDFDYIQPVTHRLARPMLRSRERRGCGASPRRGSRRVSAGSRAGPDDEGELPGDIAPPLPVGGRR